MLFEQMFERLKMAHSYRTQQLTHVAVDDSGVPTKFAWRNRKYVVLTVLLTWLESPAWWKADSRDYSIWRVEASSASADQSSSTTSSSDASCVQSRTTSQAMPATSASGVYDIAQSNTSWFIRQVMD
jgi:hypothetical protein